MNFFSYMESRYVSAQISLQKKQGTATTNLALTGATKAHMWLWLKLAAIFYFIVFPLQYVGVFLGLTQAPRSAHALAADAQAQAINEKQQREDLARKVSADLLRGATANRAEQGLDELDAKGNS